MAVIPKKQSNRSLDIGRGARVINTDGGLGAAIAGVGSSIDATGDLFIRKQQQKEDFRAENEYQKLQLSHQSAMDDEKNKIEGDGTGFHDNFLGDDYNKRNSDFITNLPRRLQEKYASKSSVANERWSINAARIESEQGKDYDRFQIGQRSEEIRSEIYSDDSKYNDGVTRGVELINASSLSKLEKQKLANELRMASVESRDLGVVERDIDYAKAVSNGISPNYIAKLIGNESSGDPNAKNKLSTATGLGQFTKGTWQDFMKEKHPETKGDIQKLRNDPDLSKQAIVWYAQKNATQLSKSGLPVNDATVYLAHFAGVGGAKSLLKANTNETAESVLGNEVIKANPFLKDMTAGEVVDWASRKMTGANSDLSFPAMTRVRRAADARVRAHKAEQKLEYDSYSDQFKLGIQTGEVDNERQILNDPVLNNGDKAIHLKAFKTANKDRIDKQKRYAKLTEKDAIWNPWDKDDKKTLNEVVEDSGIVAGLVDGDDQSIEKTISLVSETEMIPGKVESTVRTMIDQGDIDTAEKGFDILDQIYSVNPSMAIRDLGKDTIDRLHDYKALQGLIPNDEILKAVRAPADAVDANLRNTREKAANEVLKDYDLGALLNDIDTSILPFTEPDAPKDISEQTRMMLDYKNVYRAKFSHTGNAELSHKQTLDVIRSTWTSSAVNNGRLMKNAPEIYNVKVEGSHDWMMDYAKKMIKPLAGGDLRYIGHELVATEQTAADIKAKRNPAYRVMIKVGGKGQGLLEPLRDKDNNLVVLRFDPTEYQKRAREKFKNQSKAARKIASDREAWRTGNFNKSKELADAN